MILKYWQMSNNEIKHFEKVFCSHEIGFRKPDIDIYKFVSESLNIEISKILFIDDDFQNINSAITFGFKTIHLKSSTNLTNEMINLGIYLK